ncbi:hypothetical protein [Streptococcus parasanguinis]|nr:hypothetical protein [Streptococcus parasanguinis]
MDKLLILLFLTILSMPLISCSNQRNQTLDGEYYWVSESRNERAFTISGNKGILDSSVADNFVIDRKNETIELMGSQMLNRTTSYIYEDGVFTVDISGVERDYYKKDSEAYKKALKDLDENCPQ